MKARPCPRLARMSDASRASGTRTLIHSLHSFCRRRPRALSDRPPARSPVCVDTSHGDEGRAVPAEQQQATEEQHPPFPPTRPGLGRRPRDARPPAVSACAREPALRTGSRGPSWSACVRVPARPPHVTRRTSPALGAQTDRPSRTAPADVRVRACRVVGRGAVAPPPPGSSPSARRRPLRLRHLNRASAIFPASVGQARRLFWKVAAGPGGPGRARAATGGFGGPLGGLGAAAVRRADGQRPELPSHLPFPHRVTPRPRLPARSSRPRPLWGARAAAALSRRITAMAAQGEPQVQFKVRVRGGRGPWGEWGPGREDGMAGGGPGAAHAAAFSLARPGGRRRHWEDDVREAPLDGRV